MNELVCLDTNVLIRFLRADHPQLSPKAKEIFLQAQAGKIKIYLDELVVAESIWLLSSFYKLSRKEIVFKFQELILQNWIVNPRKKLILKTLKTFEETKLDYVDCWVWWVNQSVGAKLQTFDKKLEKLAASDR